MSIKIMRQKNYDTLKVSTSLSTFEYAGDFLRYSFDKSDTVPIIVNANNYFHKHTVITGRFKGALLGMPSMEGSIGYIWPEDGVDYNIDSSGFYVEATEDDTQLYCVNPNAGYKINTDRVILALGDLHTISQGTVSLIFGTGFTVNGNASTDNPKILVCQNGSADIVASAECEILKFIAISIE